MDGRKTDLTLSRCSISISSSRLISNTCRSGAKHNFCAGTLMLYRCGLVILANRSEEVRPNEHSGVSLPMNGIENRCVWLYSFVCFAMNGSTHYLRNNNLY